MSDDSNDGLPVGWESACLATLCQINPPLDRCVVNDAVQVNFVPMRAVESEGAGLVRPEARPYGEVKKGYTSFLSGDVIMAKITPCMENGKTTAVPELPGSACFGSTEFHVIRPETGVLARWIASFLVQHEVRRSAQRAMTGGVGQMRVPVAFLESLRVPIAPTKEQERIVDALDELLSDLDAGVMALERVRGKLKLYRAAVLKAAVQGALTAAWRKEHPQTEPASELLKRILAERRRRWEEEQLLTFKEKGREPPKNWKAKYNEPVPPDMTDLPLLPEGWCWASLDQLGEVGTGATPNRGQKARYYAGGTIPWVTSSCVNAPLVSKATEFVTANALEECNLTLYPAGTLLLAMYGEGKTRGKCSELLIGSTTNQALAAIQIDQDSKGYLKLFLAFNYDQTRRGASGGVQPNLNLSIVRKITLPLPPQIEQELIVGSVEDRLSIIDHLESNLDAKLTNAQALRQSILHHAFSGKLVPQDPADEPASELLKSVAAEREQRIREAAAAKKLNGHTPRRAGKPLGKTPRAKATSKKETGHGRIADR